MTTTNTTIHLDLQHHAGPIDPRIFGGFLEHLGRAVYGGVYDPGNPRSDERGFRKDVLALLRDMRMPVIRYPGGNYVSCCDWKDGVGPRDRRPRRPDFAWKSIETNQFGTDEFMQWCKALGSAPMMAVNLGTAGATDAAQLVEYCNLPAGTPWSDRRKQNGHPEPYGVKLWCLGNEMDGPWQAGHVPAEVYALRAQAAGAMMKGLDSTIETVACGSSGRGMSTYMHWDRTVLEHCWNTVDLISAHRYSNNDRNDTAWFLAEGVEVDRILEDYAGLIAYVRGVKQSNKNVHLSFDEWNVWYRHRSGNGEWKEAPHLLEEVYNLEDAIACAQYMAAFVRRADLVKVACIAQIANVIAPILVNPDGVLVQSIYYPFVMFAKNATGLSLTPVVKAPLYKAGERGEVPAVDAAASYDEAANTVCLFLTNRKTDGPADVEVEISGRRFTRVQAAEAIGGGDVKAANSWQKPDAVKPAPGKATITDAGRIRVTVPAPGFTTVKAEIEKR